MRIATYGEVRAGAPNSRMTRNVLLIDAHPDADPARFIHALAEAYAAGATEAGHAVRRIELATLDIPLLRSRGEWQDHAASPVVRAAQEDIRWATHIAFFYPLWLGDMPALLKAFLEQVARPGFALAEGAMPKPLLEGRSARIVVTMGMPAFFYRFYFGAHSVKSFERNILKLVGIHPVAHSLIGGVEGSARTRANWLRKMHALGMAAE